MAFKVTSSRTTAGAFFKPKDHDKAPAIIVEPKEFRPQVDATDFDKNPIKQDQAIARVTVFGTQAVLDSLSPSKIEETATFTHKPLVDSIKEALANESGLIVTVSKPEGKRYWAFSDADSASQAKAIAYIQKRDDAAEDELDDLLD